MVLAATAGRSVTVRGMETYYHEQGSGDVVVLVHGGGAGADSMGNWRGVMPVLADRYRVIAVDMLGFGRTAKPADPFVFSQAARTDHLAGFLDALGLSNVALVGNSMGGASALGVAVERPGLVRKLVLMGSAGLVSKIDPALEPVLGYDFTREGMIRLVRALTTDNFQIDDAMIDYRYALSVDPETRRAYSATMQWIRDQGGLYYEDDYIRRITAPTLIVNGKLDKVVPLANAYKFLELIGPSWGYIMPDCGYWAMIEHPVDFARTTAAFIEAAQ
uniref:CarC n=1 Tax=Sphingomonas sp. XLDN2-5 TaxID=411925 RepID=D5IGG3_9SPHN|nr:CarC [Sphingomonas sp. XLDN2-5]